jgi:hypothetical protein
MLDLESEYETKYIAAFLVEVPRCFHGSSKVGSFASGSDKSQLSMLPTYKSWNLGQGSRKKLLLNGSSLESGSVFGPS